MPIMTNLLTRTSALFAFSQLRRWLLVFVVGLTSLASYWILEVIRNDHGTTTNQDLTRPDYFVDNFNFVKMLPDGQSKYRLVGSKLVHYPEDDHANITSPVVTSLDPSRPLLIVSANRAVVKNMTEKAETEVYLYDNVVLNRPKTDKVEHLQLNTDYLVAYPDQDKAETNLPVEIIAGDSVTTGVGMKANNATQEMEIIKDVYSIIPPRPAKKTAAKK